MTVTMHGMNPPSRYLSADGSWYVSCNAPVGGRFQVFRVWPDGREEELVETRSKVIGGQGMLCLQQDGTLWASYGEVAGTSPTGSFQIKQFVPFARAASGFSGLDLTGMWDSVLTAAHEHDGLMHQRWNNLREMLRRNAKR